MKRILCLCLAVALLAVGFAEAQSVIAPNSAVTTPGTGGLNTLLRNSGNARTYQLGIAPSELSAIPQGAEIVGLSWRVYTGATTTWPTTAVTWTNYDITLAEAAMPVASLGTTFATNMSNPVVVRQGPMTIPAGAYPVTATNPNPFTTFYADFQAPYTYQANPNGLVIMVTHPGSDSTTNAFHETITVATNVMQAFAASTYQAATGAGSSEVVTRIHYGYGPAGGVGTNGALRLVLSNSLVSPTPSPGTMNLAVTNGVPSAAGALFISPLPMPAPLPLTGGNNLLINPAFLALVPFNLDTAGRWDLNLTFPAVPAVQSVEVQAFAADPGNAAGYVVTNAVTFQVGP